MERLEIESAMPEGWESNVILERAPAGHIMIVTVPDDTEEGDADAADD